VDPVEVAAVGPQAAHVRSGRDERLVEPDLLARGELRHPLAGVELHHARAGEQLDVVLLPPIVLERLDLVLAHRPGEVLLRQRRPRVRRVGLAPDHEDRGLGTLLAERLGAARARDAAADQEEIDGAVWH
jgi:hypothetical protein